MPAYDHNTDPVFSSILKAKIHLLMYEPFFGQIVSQLDLEITESSSWCKTVSSDGRKLYFNRQFAKSLTPKELLFVLGHEVVHCIYEHIGRKGFRKTGLWDMAIDYITNYTLVHHGLGDMPANGLYDERFTDEMTAEEIYDILLKNNVEIKIPLDDHIDAVGEGDNEGDSGGDGEGKSVTINVAGKNGKPKLTKEEIKQIRNKIKSAVIQAAQASGAGNIPAGIQRMIGDLIDPKMDWRALLDSHIRSSMKDDYTFQRLSKRDSVSGFIMPSQDILEVVEVDIAVDTSGSMTETMLRDIFSEVKGIMSTFGDFKLRAWTFDTEVYGMKEFTPNNISDIDEYSATAQGGGGTMFECNWTFMKEHGIEPDRLVLFTDGYPCGSWGDPHYCDTLFVIHGNTSIIAPFGITAYYEEPNNLQEAA